MDTLPELKKIRELTAIKHPLIHTQQLDEVIYKGKSYPIISFVIGSKNKDAPTLGLFGGVHGLERVGTHVVISYLKTLFCQLEWDHVLNRVLEETRIVSIPLINPAGMAHYRRSNPNGIDLMRNAPVDSSEEVLIPFVSGHRVSNKIPWYRGEEGKPMEKEAKALCEFVKREVYPSEIAITVDFHSGFGLRDRFWYPYARSKERFPRFYEVQEIKNLLDKTFPHHVYIIEPQSDNFMAHGDLWDHIFDLHHTNKKYEGNIFLPWTLEMGSWLWVKKNPFQLLNPLGLFNPMKEHRYSRVMRRHLLLIDFLFKMIRNKSSWTKAA